ncbi:MAG: hypothetical protein R2739_06960 [Chitinophagales bacterium]
MQIQYSLSFPAPHTHYVEVTMSIKQITQDALQLKMPVWTPGSYLIREFQKNIDFVEVTYNNNTTQRVQKTNKNTWIVDTKNQSEININYKIYCFEYSVRTNFVDDSHALINGAATYLYVVGEEESSVEVSINPHSTWQNISTSLNTKENNKWIRTAANLDELVDSPIEIGNHISYFFEVENVHHEIAMYGKSNCDIEKLIADLKSIIEEEIKIFGAHPCSNYVFIIHNTNNSYGGLEHKNSSVNHVTRWSYDDENYQKAISLLAHEYFHLWNVKRIRPTTLIPYNYEVENYTDTLWFFEGVTSYYDDYICYRAGVTSLRNYLSIVENNLEDALNTAGADTQTLAESSFDTWLKYYRRDEHSNNAQISYYKQGAIVAMLFDFIIIKETNGEKCLDDVMQSLYSDYLQNPNEGIDEAKLIRVFTSVSGIDFAPIYHKFIHTTATIKPAAYFNALDLNLNSFSPDNSIHLGMKTKWENGRLIVTELDKNYGAYQSGININDEIIAIDNFRTDKDYKKLFEGKSLNHSITFLLSRNGIIKTIDVKLSEDKRKKYSITQNSNKKDFTDKYILKWLGQIL